MTVNEFLNSWNPSVSYLDVDALKTRFSALRGLSNVRPNLAIDELVTLADNVLVVNQKQYENLVNVDPFKTYLEHSNGSYKDTHSGTDTNTTKDTQVHHNEFSPGVSDISKVDYGRIDDTTVTPSGMRQTDQFTYAYNATAANQPDNRTQESYLNNYNEKTNDKLSGSDTTTLSHTGINTTTDQVLDGDVTNTFDHGEILDNQHNDEKSGYNLRDIVDLLPQWITVYDMIAHDVFTVIGVLVATRKIDYSLDW